MAGRMIVFGTRPEAIKLAPVIHALTARGERPRLCVTGQHRALLDDVLRIEGIVPDIDLDLMRPGQSLNALTASLLTALDDVFTNERPDQVMVQGDTTSAMAAALAAHHLRIPVAHIEAGLRSGDTGNPWPEEHNRRAIGSIAGLHFAPTVGAARALIAEGCAADTVHVTGNTAIDALHAMQGRLRSRPGLADAARPALDRLGERCLILVTCHRRETIGRGIAEIAAAIRALSARPDVLIALPLHPNPAIGDVLRTSLVDVRNLVLLPPLDYPAFVRLLDAAHLILTDSGGVQEEAPALGTPVLVLRYTTERSEAVDEGTARLVGTKARRIVAETCRLLDDPIAHARMARVHHAFGDGRAAERIADILTGIAQMERTTV